MKVIKPGGLLAEAADVLASVREDVVVVGAVALEVVLADGIIDAITPGGCSRHRRRRRRTR